MVIKVQREDFDSFVEVCTLQLDKGDIGAVVTFLGLVRQNEARNLTTLELEHFPGMTERALADLEQQALSRWDIGAVLVIHRYGRLAIGENIMMVAVTSRHRTEAFQAAEFLMDHLKTDAPFWKKEHLNDGHKWVEAAASDDVKRARWRELG